jgi:large subunit ribosomal protein L22
MEIKVRLSNLRIAPRKVRLVADLVRGKTALEAQTILSFTVNKPARSILKLLNSAIATAKHDFHLDENTLFISKITGDEGPKLKRWHPMSRGRAFTILKRTSHVELILSNNISAKPQAKKSKIKKEEVKIEKVEPKEVKKVVRKKATKK